LPGVVLLEHGGVVVVGFGPYLKDQLVSFSALTQPGHPSKVGEMSASLSCGVHSTPCDALVLYL